MFIAEDSLIDEKFQLRGTIGHGGMGVVYEAHQLGLDRIVALKLLSCVPEESKNEVVRFEREALILSKLSHINIVQFYAYGTWSGLPYIAMERLVGESLHKLLAKNAPLPLPETIEYARQICDGLEHAHMHGIIHRDIKPTNVILSTGPEGRLILKIIDFGLAKLTGQDVQQLTQANTALGSVLYMSPEQCSGRPIDHRSDIYSFGCLLYHCLIGEPPYCADNSLAVMFQQVNEPVQNTSGWHSLPAALQNLLARCMAKEPADRFQSCGEVKDSLRQAAQSESVAIGISSSKNPVASATNPENLYAAQAKRSDKKLLVAPVLAISCALTLVAGIFWSTAHKAPPQRANHGAITALSSPKEIMMSLLHSQEHSHGVKLKPLSPAEVEQLAQAVEQCRHDPAIDTDTLFAAYLLLGNQYEAIGETEKLRSALATALKSEVRSSKPDNYVFVLSRYHALCSVSGGELSLVHRLEEAKQLFPHMSRSRQCDIDVLLAVDYMKLKRYAEARPLLQSIITRSKEKWQVDQARSLLRSLDDIANANERIKLLSPQVAKQIKTKQAPGVAYHQLVQCYRQIGKDPTELILQQLSNPADSPSNKLILRYELGQSYLKQGNQDKCERTWTDMLEPVRTVILPAVRPMESVIDYYNPVFGLAQLYLATGRYRECVRLTEQWLKALGNSEGLETCVGSVTLYRAHAYRHLGATADAQKMYMQAITNLESAIERNKTDRQSLIWLAEAKCGLACSLYLRGQYKEALLVSDQAMNDATAMNKASLNGDYPRLVCCRIVRTACLEKVGHVQEAAVQRKLAKSELAGISPQVVRRMSYIFDDVIQLAPLRAN